MEVQTDDFCFSPKGDLFQHGLLPLKPDSTLSFGSLLQLSKKYRAVHEMSAQYFRTISYELPREAPFAYLEWRTVGIEDLKLKEIHIQTLWERFRNIKYSRENKWKRTEPFTGVVNFYEFLMFLAAQLCNKISIKDSRIYQTDAVSRQTRQGGHQKKILSQVQSKFGAIPEDVQLHFVSTHLHHILRLLCNSSFHIHGNEPQTKSDTEESIQLISPAELNFANIMLGESNGDTWARILPLPLYKNKYKLNQVVAFIGSHLVATQSSVRTKFLPLSFGPLDNETIIRVDAHSIPKAKSKLITVEHSIAEAPLPLHEKNILEQLASSYSFDYSESTEDNLNQTTCEEDPLPLEAFHVKSIDLTRAVKSFVYLLFPMGNASMKSCVNSTVVFGAVGGILTLEDCHNCQVIAACHSIQLCNCTGIQLNILVNQNPLLVGDNHGLVFGPYNTFYASLQRHLDTVGLTPYVNAWDKPIPYSKTVIYDLHESNCDIQEEDTRTLHIYEIIDSNLGFDTTNLEDIENIRALHTDQTSKVAQGPVSLHKTYLAIDQDFLDHSFGLQDPQSFVPFSIPVILSGDTTRNPIPLPTPYRDALAAHAAKFQGFAHVMRDSSRSGEELKAQIFAKYQEWLRTTGNLQQIEHLVTHQLSVTNFPILDFKPRTGPLKYS